MRNILLAVTVAGLAGCVAGIDMPNTPPPEPPGPPVPPGPPSQTARKAFDDGVYPIISAKCSSCHSAAGPSGNVTGFVATSAADGYVTAVGYQALVGDLTPAGAPVLLKISATGGHHGVVPYTSAETSAITTWLNAELQGRAGNPTPTPTGDSPAEITAKLTAEWSGCMTLANFTAANMVAWGNMRADNSACKTCHIDGEYGQIASDVADVPAPGVSFFKTISTNRYYMAQYFSVDLVNKKMIINTRSFTGVGQALAPHTEHPRFNLTNSTGMAALQSFYDKTMAAKTAGTCGPSTLTN